MHILTLLKRSEVLMLWLIILVGLTLRLAAVYAYHHVPESDELAYLTMAQSLVQGKQMVDTDGNHAMYNVGYPLFILAPVFWIAGEQLLFVKIINALLGAGSIALCHAVAKAAGAGRNGRLLAAAMWALYLPASIYCVYLFKENLMVPLMLGTLWCALQLMRTPSLAVSAGCGLLIGLLALTGNAALSLGASIGFALFRCSSPLASKAKYAGVMVIVAIVVASPWVVRNMQTIDAPVLNTNGGFNLYLGNNPVATGMFMSITETPRASTWEALRKIGEVHASETLKKEAVDWIRENPVTFMQLAIRKLGYFWSPPLHAGKGPPSRIESIVRTVWLWEFIILAAAAIGTVLLPKVRTPTVMLLWLAIAAYTAGHMVFYVVFRYREPIMPVVCILAGMTLDYLHQRSKAWRHVNRPASCSSERT